MNTEVETVFLNRLKSLMDSKDVKQADICKLTGLSSSQMHHLASGRTKSPSLSTACKIALALDVSLDYLGGLIDEPRPLKRDADGNIVAPESLLQRQLGDGFSKLNDEGQMKAVDYVRDLTELERYTDRAKNEAGDGAGA